MSAKERLWKIHELKIRRTESESPIPAMKIRLTKITRRTRQATGCAQRKIYIHTRALKHLYDKKPAEEFDFLIDHLITIIRSPDLLYRNKYDKTGNFCIVKEIAGHRYIAIIEVKAKQTIDEEIWIVTAFRVRDNKYLRTYDLLRSWRDGAHSS
jgi:hypothetical protein